MTRKSEILFIDPAVSDIDTILTELRPDVDAVLLESGRPAAQQMAEALACRRDLQAVHVIAHGAPGRVSFAAGDWSTATGREEGDELAAIGRALAPHGDLRLWSCETASGEVGSALVAAISRAVGAPVAASTVRVGAAALGGAWQLLERPMINREHG